MPEGEAAVDAKLDIVFDGETYEGSVTLVPGRDGVLSVWGTGWDNWADDVTMGALADWIHNTDAEGWGRDVKTLIGEIEGKVNAAA